MIPAINSDPDPTSQLTWPSSRRDRAQLGHGLRRDESSRSSASRTVGDADLDVDGANKIVDTGRKKLLSTWNLVTLSISMAGAQIAWTVELGYGTPFLLSLGLSEQLTSLVWLAGPISGLIAQPLIGAISDSSRSKYRRRFWIALSTLVLVVSTLILAYCQSIAAFFVDIFAVWEEDWSEERKKAVANTSIGFAVVSFYLLDFALNALQASLRNLLLDVTPSSQINAGNAWHGRMTHAGNIIGYGFGTKPFISSTVLLRSY
jgi:solute carrier family 45 protein 1/2/4